MRIQRGISARSAPSIVRRMRCNAERGCVFLRRTAARLSRRKAGEIKWGENTADTGSTPDTGGTPGARDVEIMGNMGSAQGIRGAETMENVGNTQGIRGAETMENVGNTRGVRGAEVSENLGNTRRILSPETVKSIEVTWGGTGNP